MSRQISAKHSSQLRLNTAPLQKLVVDLNEPDEECLSGGLQRLQEEFQAQLKLASSEIIVFIIL